MGFDLPAAVTWQAFGSGPAHRRGGGNLYPPSPFWEQARLSPAAWSERTELFNDDLGLPKSIHLVTAESESMYEYPVLSSTNVLGWSVPTGFKGVTYRQRPGRRPAMHLLFAARITNNPAIADLAEQLLARSIALSPTFDSFALGILKQQAPERAQRFLEEYWEWPGGGGNGLLAELLDLNPQHEPALRILEETLTRNLTEPGWLVGASGDQFLPLRHVLPEATNIVALLEKLSVQASEQRRSGKGDARWESDLRNALRHIELNGKLQSLRERDAAGGN